MAVSHGNRAATIKNTAAAAWTTATWATSDSPAPPSVASGDLLLIGVALASNITISSCTHNGIALTSAGAHYHSSLGVKEQFFYTTTPSTGIQNIVVTLSSAYFSGISISAMCFAGASGVGTPVWNDASSDPNTQSYSVSAGSMMYATGGSNVAHDDITIDGNVVTGVSGNLSPNQSNINKIYSGSWSGSSHSAGSITIETDGTSGVISNSHIEILASGGGGGSRRIFLIT